MKTLSTWLVAPLLFAALLFFAGCSNKEENPTGAGPAEQIGREIDQAVREAKKQAQEIEKKLGKEMEQAGKALQESDRPNE
jgi:hypothetical protein